MRSIRWRYIGIFEIQEKYRGQIARGYRNNERKRALYDKKKDNARFAKGKLRNGRSI